MAPSRAQATASAPSSQREEIRRRSKSVLGNLDRIEVCAAIARSDDGLVNATDLEAELGIAQSRVRNQLVALVDGGLLTALPRTPGKQWYQRLDSRFWPLCEALFEEWAE